MKISKALLLPLVLMIGAHSALAEYPEVQQIYNSYPSAGVQNKLKAANEFRASGQYTKSIIEIRAAASQHSKEKRRASNTYKVLSETGSK